MYQGCIVMTIFVGNFILSSFLSTSETTYYVIDSAKIDRARKDSLFNQDLYTVEKDTSMYFSTAKLLERATYEAEIKETGHEGVKRPFMLDGDDGILGLLLICFVFFARIYKGGFSFFRENFRLLFSSRKNLDVYRETTTAEFWFHFILIFQSILLSSIVMFDSFLELDQYPIPQHSFYTIFLFTLTITVFQLIKYLICKFIGYLFTIQHIISVWIKNYLIVLEMMGVIAFIPTLMFVYSQSFHKYLLIFFLALFILSKMILFYRLITFFLRENVNFLFLIAYLCSVEIIPYFILYQVLIYLYNIDIINWLWH